MGFQEKGGCRVPLLQKQPQKLVLEGSRVPGKESKDREGSTRGQGRGRRGSLEQKEGAGAESQ